MGCRHWNGSKRRSSCTSQGAASKGASGTAAAPVCTTRPICGVETTHRPACQALARPPSRDLWRHGCRHRATGTYLRRVLRWWAGKGPAAARSHNALRALHPAHLLPYAAETQSVITQDHAAALAAAGSCAPDLITVPCLGHRAAAAQPINALADTAVPAPPALLPWRDASAGHWRTPRARQRAQQSHRHRHPNGRVASVPPPRAEPGRSRLPAHCRCRQRRPCRTAPWPHRPCHRYRAHGAGRPRCGCRACRAPAQQHQHPRPQRALHRDDDAAPRPEWQSTAPRNPPPPRSSPTGARLQGHPAGAACWPPAQVPRPHQLAGWLAKAPLRALQMHRCVRPHPA